MVSIDFYQYNEYFALLQKKAAEFFSNAKIAKIFLVAIVIIFIWTCYLLGSLVFGYKNWQDLESVVIKDDVSLSKASVAVNITKKHLFGELVRPGGSLADAIKSDLPLKLKGIIAGKNPKLGSAIIADEAAKEESYIVGDKLPIAGSKVTLEYIFKDKIYLKNGQVLEYIEYPKLEDKKSSESAGKSSFEGYKSQPVPSAGSGLKSRFRRKTKSRANDDDDDQDQNNSRRRKLHKQHLDKITKLRNRYKRTYN